MISLVVTVVSPSAPTAALTSLSSSTIYAGGTSTVTVTLTNPNSDVALSGVGNSISLPSGVTVASTPGASTTCSGGSVSATAGGSSVSLSGGSLATSATCTMTFNVTSSTVATHTIPSGTPSATGASAGSAGTTSSLTVQATPSVPTISAAWDQATVASGSNRTLTLTIANPNAGTQLTGVAVSAAALPANLSGSSANTSCTGGTASYNGGTRELSLSGATLNASASCTVTLTVTSSTPGTYSYTTGTVSASGPVSLTGSTATSGNLTVVAPPTAAVGVTSPINIGNSSTLTLTLANPNSGTAFTGLANSISLPSNVVVAGTPNLSNNGCGGTATATAGSGSISLTGGTLAAATSCTITVSITSSVASTYTIPTGTPSSSQGGTGVAGTSASLTVNSVPPVLSAFTATAVNYGSSGNSIDALTGTSATNGPSGWVVSKDGVSFAAAAESVNHSGSNNVSINSSGVVTYAAPTGRRGSDSFYVRASNGGGNSNVVLVTVPINNPTLSISLAGSGTRGSALSGVQVNSSGGQSPYSCNTTLVSGSLPSGATLNSDCTITGTPSVAGSFTFTVSVTDSSTGTGAFTQTSGTLTLNVVPQTPTISGLTPATGSTAGGTSVEIAGTNFTQVSSISFGGTVVAGTVNSETSITITSPAHAAGAVDVAVTTSGGTSANTAADNFTYITPPSAPVVVAPANSSRTSDTTPTYSGTSGNSLTITVYVDGSSIGTTTSSGGGAWSLTQPSALADGSHSVYATATQSGVVSSNSTTNSFTVDTSAPAAPVVVTPANGSRTNDTTPTISGTAEAGATVVVTIGATVLPGVTADGSGNFSATPGSALADGTYNVSAVASDVAGNSSATSNSNSVTIDSTAPAAPVVTAPSAGATTSTTPTISGTGEVGATIAVLIDGSSVGTTTADGSGNWTLTSGSIATGAHTASARATDQAGNVSPTSSPAINFTAALIPTVTALSPGSGPVAGGTSVVLTGTSLTGATAVSFGGSAATGFTVDSATQITATAPAGGGTVNVTVTTAAGTSTTGAGNQYSYVGLPSVTGLSPTSGTTAGGTSVTITGTNLSDASVVSFGGTAATGFTVNSATQITATAPAGTGTGNVRVTTVGGTSATAAANLYSWSPSAPVISSPVAATTTSDNTPIYAGTAQAGASVNVSVDGGSANSVTADGAGNWVYTQASALPDGAHSVQASATIGGVTGASSSAVSFTVDTTAPSAPVVASPANNATINDTTPTVSGTADAGGTVNVILDGSAAGSVVATGGNWSFTSGVLAEGVHTVRATATDAASNVSASSATNSFTVDATAPAAPVVSAPANGANINNNLPNITGTAEANAIVTIFIDAASAGTSNASAGGAWSFTPGTALSDGAHSVTARAADAGGNVSVDSNTNSFTLDAAAPAAPSITAPAQGSTTNDNTPTLSGTAEANTTVTITIDGTSAGTTTASAGGAWSFTTATLTDASHAAYVTATDASGNVSAHSATRNFTVDTTAPTAPVVVAPANGSQTSDTTPTMTGTAEAGATVAIIIDGAAAGAATVDGAGAWSFTSGTALSEAVHSVRATASDAAGNVSASSATNSFRVDASLPAAPVVSAPANGTTINNTTPTITGTAEASATVRVFVDGTQTGSVSANGAGGWSYTTATLAEGAHTAYAVAVDAAGNVSGASISNSFSIYLPPVASAPGTVQVPYNIATAVALASSISGNVTSLAVTTAPAHGAAVVAGLVVTYTPTAGYFGADSFAYAATGPGGTSAPATVSLNVATPAAPVAADKSGIAVGYNSAGEAIDLTASITGVRTSIAVGTAPAHGTATIAGEIITYVPASGYFGADSFTYTATGPGGTSNIATVSLTVGLPPVPVVANKSGVAVPFNSSGTAIDLTASITGVYTSINLTTQPGNGTVSVAGAVLTYTPATNVYGDDSFMVAATGPGGTSAAATVSLTIATPPPPVVKQGGETVPGVGSTSSGAPAELDLSTLVTGFYTTVQIARPPSHGTVTLTGGASPTGLRARGTAHIAAISGPVMATYRPNPGFVGVDSFEFIAVGPGGTSVPAIFTVNVVGVVPTVLAKAASAGDGETVSVELTEGATEGPFTDARIVSVSPASAAATGIVASGSGASRSYRLDVTPVARVAGQIVISYSLSNQYGESAPANVTVTVTARPNPAMDSTVRGLNDAQAETARRFAHNQIGNFMQRNEQLHGGGGSAKPQLGLRLNWRDAIARRMPPPGVDDATFTNRLVAPRESTDRRSARATESAEATGRPRSRVADSAEPTAAEATAAASGKEGEGDGQRRVGQLAVWNAGAIEIGTIDKRTDRAKITATTSGLSAGMDIKLSNRLIAGLGVGYGNEDSWIGGSAAHLRGESTMVAGYASYSPVDAAFIDGMIGLGQIDYRMRRKVTDVDAVASGYREGDMIFGALSAGIDRSKDALSWSAYGRFEWMEAHLGAYAETGAGRYNLRWDRRSLTSLGGVLGGRAEWMRKTGFGSVTPHFRGEWRHEFGNNDPQWLDYADIPGAALYRIDGQGWRRDQLDLSVGTRFDLSSWVLDLEYAMSASAGQRSGRLKMGLSKEF